MIALVFGGSACGKSAFAERLLSACPGAPRYYAACMEPYGEEAEERIRRHRALRAGKGVLTVEAQRNLSALSLPAGCAVLLECLGTLTANELFSPGASEESALRAIRSGLDFLEERCASVVLVGNDVFADGVAYEEGTAAYLRVLAAVQRESARRAALVAEIVCGLPIIHKGSPELFGVSLSGKERLSP